MAQWWRWREAFGRWGWFPADSPTTYNALYWAYQESKPDWDGPVLTVNTTRSF